MSDLHLFTMGNQIMFQSEADTHHQNWSEFKQALSVFKNIKTPKVQLWYDSNNDGAIYEKFDQKINHTLSLIALGYIRQYVCKKEITKLILKYYLTFSQHSCYDMTFSRMRNHPNIIQEFLIKLSTKTFGNNWYTQFIDTFKSFRVSGTHFWTSHYKTYLSCCNDLLTYFMYNVQTKHVIELVNFLKKLILQSEYYEYKKCHKICS
eukprot:39374_1